MLLGLPQPVSGAQFTVSLHFLEGTSQRHGLDLSVQKPGCSSTERLSAVGPPSQRSSPSSGTHLGGPEGSLCWNLFLLPKRHLGSWQAGGLCLERSPAKSLASGRPDPLLPQETASILSGKEGAWIGSKMPGTAKPCRPSAQRERAQATGRGAIPLLSGHAASKAQSRWELCLCSSLRPWEMPGAASGELPGHQH